MKLFLFTIIVPFLGANGIDGESIGGIYTEALIFISVFGLMSIVSIVISKRDAKKFETTNPLEDRKAARREEVLKRELEDMPVIVQKNDTDRLIQLSNMLKDGLITQEEFSSLKSDLNIPKK